MVSFKASIIFLIGIFAIASAAKEARDKRGFAYGGYGYGALPYSGHAGYSYGLGYGLGHLGESSGYPYGYTSYDNYDGMPYDDLSYIHH